MQKRFSRYDFDSTRIGEKTNTTLCHKLYFTSPRVPSKLGGLRYAAHVLGVTYVAGV